MANLLARKLENFAQLRAATVAAHVDVIREGDEPNNVFLVLEGFACRYKGATVLKLLKSPPLPRAS